MKRIAVVMGSPTDLPVVEQALDVLREYDLSFDVRVLSAHRTPRAAQEFAVYAREEGFGAIIAVAGKAAHLAGTIAANTTLPVIGLPIRSSELDGIDALLATVQMPSGIPVATVAINGGTNAALLAVQILAVEDEAMAERLRQAREAMGRNVAENDIEIRRKYSR